MAGRSHSSFRLDPAGLALAAAALFACDSGPKSRVESEAPDAALPDATAAGGAQTDAEPGGTATPADAAPQPGTDALPAVDAAPPADGAAPGDAAPPPPDAAPGPPEVCNGEDEDGDGLIDEGVANLCGGCGGLPPEGCQSWRVDMTQTAADAQTLNPNRLVGLQGSVTSTVERDIEGGRCLFQRSLGPTPDAHVGIVTLTTPLRALTQVPVYDGLSHSIRYDASPESGPVQLFADGQTIQVQAGGGQLVGGFDGELPAPLRIEVSETASCRGRSTSCGGRGPSRSRCIGRRCRRRTTARCASSSGAAARSSTAAGLPRHHLLPARRAARGRRRARDGPGALAIHAGGQLHLGLPPPRERTAHHSGAPRRGTLGGQPGRAAGLGQPRRAGPAELRHSAPSPDVRRLTPGDPSRSAGPSRRATGRSSSRSFTETPTAPRRTTSRARSGIRPPAASFCPARPPWAGPTPRTRPGCCPCGGISRRSTCRGRIAAASPTASR
jgi:hypothetical protein